MLTYGLKFSKVDVISNNASSYQAFYIKKSQIIIQIEIV